MNQTIKKRIEEINSGIVPEGYEKTSFGIFPCDWEKSILGSICEINPKTEKLPEVFVYIDLESVVDGKLIYENVIEKAIAPSRAQRLLRINDVIYQMVRPYQKNNFIFIQENKKYKYVVSTGYAQLRSNNYCFLYQLINSEYFCVQVLKKCTGTNYPAVNSQDLAEVNCAYPKTEQEQSRIAEILMQWDKAIELLEKYIKQLEFRKKAIMQKLLTPKNGWGERNLNNLCKIETGKLDVNAMVENGEYPFFTCSKQIYKIDQYAYDCEALLMAGNGDIGDIKYYNGKFNAYQRTYVLYDFSCDIKYVMYFLQQNFDRAFIRGTQRSSMPFIKLELLKEAIIKIPKNKDFVVKILSQADIEISLQAQKLKKLLEQRKAMQQYLLTGIVRV